MEERRQEFVTPATPRGLVGFAFPNTFSIVPRTTRGKLSFPKSTAVSCALLLETCCCRDGCRDISCHDGVSFALYHVIASDGAPSQAEMTILA